MRLTTDRYWHQNVRTPGGPRRMVAVLALAAAMALVFVVDRFTDIPAVQHLYYLPIVFAAIRFGTLGGIGASAIAIVLYHFANPHMLTWRYEQVDIVQMAVFVAAGLVASKLADDARRLHELAMTDDLTGLHNLRSFELALRRMVRAARQEKTPLSVLVLDVDRLKSLNDEYGHLAGAEAVRTVGHLMAKHIPADAIGCRYGGDEFVIALPHCSAPEASRIADNLRRAVFANAPVLAGLKFPEGTLSISIGLASFDGSAATRGSSLDEDAEGEALFQSADTALYIAKNGGRNRVSTARHGSRVSD
jgi:diguanylate cyclase (GGDEF)-like protein